MRFFRKFLVSLAAALISVAFLVLLVACFFRAGRPPRLGPGVLWVLGSVLVAIAIHEGGHYLFARLLGVGVEAIHIGSPPALATIRLGSLRLCLGVRPRGQITFSATPSPGRRAAVTAGGPLANLLTAPAFLILPVARWAALSLALICGYVGLVSLVPTRLRAGLRSDGASLLRAPAQHRAEGDLHRLMELPDWASRSDAADRFLRGYKLGAPAALRRFHFLASLLRAAGRHRELLEIHSGITVRDTPSQDLVGAVHALEWQVLTIPDLPPGAANLAGRRMEWVRRNKTGPVRGIQHTVALARLRQGRFAAVEPLCAADLETDLQPSERATVLATVALARHALGQDGDEPLRAALTLDPAADLVGEADGVISRTVLSGGRC